MTDPYEGLAALRAAGAVSQVQTAEGLPVWLVTGHQEVRDALADPRLCQDGPEAQRLADQQAEGMDLGADIVHMLNSDPPVHTRLRRVVAGSFTAGRIAALRPAVQRLADGLLDAMATMAEPDLIRDYAFPLPVAVICELLGVPDGDRSAFRDWSTALVTHERADGGAPATQAMRDYLSGVLARKRADPGPDVLSDLLRAQDAGELSEDEVVAMAILLLIAGHETTVGLIGNAVLLLLSHPAELATVRHAAAAGDPAPIAAALDELLRLESPVAMATLRFTTAPVRLGGVDLPAGAFVLPAIGAANRDPARFPDPDRPDLHRGGRGQIAFGHGIHRCLGAPLARMEGEVALGRLLARFPGLRRRGGPDGLRWRDTPMLRGLESLPVALEASAAPEALAASQALPGEAAASVIPLDQVAQ